LIENQAVSATSYFVISRFMPIGLGCYTETIKYCWKLKNHGIVNPQLLDMRENIEELHDAFEDFLDEMLREVLDLFGD
jgi:hypothetical protein